MITFRVSFSPEYQDCRVREKSSTSGSDHELRDVHQVHRHHGEPGHRPTCL